MFHKVKSMPRTETKFLVRGQNSKACPVPKRSFWCGVKSQKEKGVSLYLAVVILAILLGISLGLSSLIVAKIKIILGMEESVIALYAADTGIEQVLMEKENPIDFDGDHYILDLGGGQQAFYDITVLSFGDQGCQEFNFCVKSIGTYKNTRRAIEIEY